VLSRRESHRAGLAALATCLVALALPMPRLHAQESQPAPTDAEIATALGRVKADPNLATETRARVLRWNESTDATPPRNDGWVNWIGQLFSWLGETSRVLMWLVLIVLTALLALGIVRVIQNARGTGKRQRRVDVPTHVRDLDIRPESLPEDIGAAALAHWEAGEHRAALSLLYRGLLSRLVHVHAVPIRQSTTEGDCLALAARHLEGERASYVSRLVRVWQRAVYGGYDPETSDVRVLCDGFATALSMSARSTGVGA